MKTYQTDVLIVGGGGAATAATISAHEAGVKTTMAVKGRFGIAGVRGAGATSNPLADFWTIRTVGPKGGLFNPPDAVYRDMVQTGLGMADRSSAASSSTRSAKPSSACARWAWRFKARCWP